jgi:uncharacterized membrane protein YfcA
MELGGLDGILVSVAVGFVVASLTTPVGVSGAFLLVPWQTQALGESGLSVSSTNLVFNLLTTPVAVARFRAAGRLDLPLARLVLFGSVPGVVLGVVLRVYGLAAPRLFLSLVGLVLVLLAVRLWRYTPLQRAAPSSTSPPAEIRSRSDRSGRSPTEFGEGRADPEDPSSRAITTWALATAVIGGAYGVGGGSLLAPILVRMGLPVTRVAGATLLATGVTSAVGLVGYLALAAIGEPTEPDWQRGLAFGIGGAVGALTGAWTQTRVDERLLRTGLAALTLVAAVAALARAAVV